MEIDVQPLPGTSKVTSVAIDGRIDSYTVDRVEEELNSLIRIGSSKLICDLSGVEFVASSGFKAFRRIIKFAKEQEGDVKFCGLNADVNRLFQSVGFTREAGVYESVDKALDAFENGDGGPKVSATDSAIGKALRKFIGLDKEEEGEEQEADEEKGNSSMQQTRILPKESSFKETVIFSKKNQTKEEPGRFAVFEPVKFTLFPEKSRFQNVSQLLGTIGSLAGFPSEQLVNLNVAVNELCRSMANELQPDETFGVEIDCKSAEISVSLKIPRENCQIYGMIHPQASDEPLTSEEGREWLLTYADEVEVSESGDETMIQLTVGTSAKE